MKAKILKENKMKQSLYQITEQQRYTLSEIESMGGELTPELEAQLEITATQLNGKSIGYLEIITQEDGDINLIDTQIKRLQAIKKSKINLVTRLKENLLNAVKTFGAFEVGFNKFGTRVSHTLEVEDINSLPKEFKVIKVTETADKMLLKKALRDGAEIKGVKLVEHLNLKID